MTSEQELYHQALTAIHSGDASKAREILTRLLKTDPKNVDYWLWMSAIVLTVKERVYCLRQVLAIDPENDEAAAGLRMVGEKAPPPNPAKFHPIQSIPWKTSLEIENEKPASQKGLRSRVVLYTVLGIAVVGLLSFGIFLALRPRAQVDTGPVKRWTLTPSLTATITSTPKPTSTGPSALSVVLDSTFTPTPLYVATPHNRLEAYNAAMRAYEKEDWGNAVEYFQQVIASEPNSADVYYHLGDVYRFQGLYKEAMSAYDSAIKIDANFAPAYLGKGRVYLEQSPSDLDKAQTVLQKALERDPKMYEVYLELANVSIAQGDGNAALGWLDNLADAMPENGKVELARAQAYLLLGDNEKALDEIELAHEYDKSLIGVYKVWGRILQSVGQYKESIPPILTVLENDPLDLESEALLARAYYEIGNTEKAFSLISTILQQDDKDIEAYLLRADIYLEKGQIDEASADFNAVLRLDYENFEANLGGGRVLLAQTLAGSAYNKFGYTEKFARTDSQKAILLYWRAKSLQGLDQTSAAIRDFEDALAYPGNLLPQVLREDAEIQLSMLYTPTPTLKATETATPTITPKATTTATKVVSPTSKPTQ